MADSYVKLQSPIMNGNQGVFPLTTYDQIILEDGSRWNGKQISDSDNYMTLAPDGDISQIVAEKAGLPAQAGSVFYYLPTTADQVILSDGTRLEVDGKLKIPVQRVSYAFTLTADGWIGEGAPYTQTVAVEGLLASDLLSADVDMTEATPDTYGTINQGWNFIGRLHAEDGSVTAFCYEDHLPQLDLKINMFGLREV